MKGTVGFYVWVCVIGCVAWSAGALPAGLGNDLEEEEQGIANWVQGVETPMRHQFWGDVAVEEEDDEMDTMSPDSDKRQWPGGKRQWPGGKRQWPGGKRQWPGGKRQWPGGKRQWPGGKRQYPAGKRQFVGGETIPSPELRQYPAGKRQYPGGKRQYPGGKRQWPGGKRQYLGGKRSESDQDLLPMEIRQFPAGKRQWPGGKRQWPGGKRQWPGGKRQFVGGELLEQESPISKRFAPEEDALEVLRLSQLYDTNDNFGMGEEDELQLEDLLDDIMVDTRPVIDQPRHAMGTLLDDVDPQEAIDLLLNDRVPMRGW